MSSNEFLDTSTIAAVATAAGRGGIGIIRISGPLAKPIGEHIAQQNLSPRHAHYCQFYSNDKNQNIAIDQGIAIYFQGPHSFTGEDCVELQGHGGPVILDLILNTVLKHGARLAQPGEFSQRAFLNDKIDLAQAEAIADLINANSQQSARNALNSLQGVFSNKIDALIDQLTHLRIYVEAAIDFPEEEIDFLNDGKIATFLGEIRSQLKDLLEKSQQGIIMREGIRIVIAGKPNVGKSSLLNALSEKESAIVTDIEGTTRDVLREHINIEGVPIHIVDTAGLRDNPDKVEEIGISRAHQEFELADRVLLVVDSNTEAELDLESIWPATGGQQPDPQRVTILCNKIDLNAKAPGIVQGQEITTINISTQDKRGIDDLRRHLLEVAGFSSTTEGSFTARRRHLDALIRAQELVEHGANQLSVNAGELLAEDLRCAQQALGEITGALNADELLGKIFSDFCIGK